MYLFGYASWTFKLQKISGKEILLQYPNLRAAVTFPKMLAGLFSYLKRHFYLSESNRCYFLTKELKLSTSKSERRFAAFIQCRDCCFLFAGERCLDHDTNMMALLKVNPHAEWIVKPRDHCHNFWGMLGSGSHVITSYVQKSVYTWCLNRQIGVPMQKNYFCQAHQHDCHNLWVPQDRRSVHSGQTQRAYAIWPVSLPTNYREIKKLFQKVKR